MASKVTPSIQTPVTNRIVHFGGGSLFELAAQEFDDATQWYRIAQVNDLVDPWINTIVTLKIPPKVPASTSNGGILGS